MGPRVYPGDVLVAINIAPKWTLIFGIIGALVLYQGSLTQHGAVVARDATGIISNWEAFGVNGDPDVVELDA